MKNILRKEILYPVLILSEIVFILLAIFFLSKIAIIRILLIILSIIAVLLISDSDESPRFKLSKIVPILIFPLYGGVIWLILRKKRPERNPCLYRKRDSDITASYLMNMGFMAFSSKGSRYFPDGESLFEEMLNRINAAKRYIYIEFFIIAEGKALDKLIEALKRKSSEGVTIKIIIDHMGSLFVKPKNFIKEMADFEIECRQFNPINPLKLNRLNLRDQRKILVVDGKYSFTGGINISDEYMNYKLRFGIWKDTGVMVEGKAANAFSVMFEDMWEAIGENRHYEQRKETEASPLPDKAYCIPFYDSPFDDIKLSLSLYLSIINCARKCLYITTPYLICDDEILNALKTAALSGIDVKLILPGVPDKKLINIVTKSCYPTLLESGVEIYEYSEGFIHSKTIVADEEKAVAGTVNLDYRSMSETFECGCYFVKCGAAGEISEDFIDTLSQCRRITPLEIKKNPLFSKVARGLLKLFAPLM